MKIQRGLSYTLQADSFGAGKWAMEEVLRQMDGRQPDFLFMFITTGHNIAEAIAGIWQAGGNIPLCGCSGAGVISHIGCDEATHSIGLMGIKSDRICFTPFIFPNLSQNSQKIGTEIGKLIRTEELSPSDKKLLFLFPDGLTLNAEALNQGIVGELGHHIDCVGGAAANDYQPDRTFQFCGDNILSNALSGVLLSGDFSYEIGVSHGSRPAGLFRTITRARDNIIYEIDHRPALDLLKDFIGEDRLRDLGQILNLFELGEAFEQKQYPGNVLNRAIIGIDKARGSITLGTRIAEGTKVRVTRREKVRVLRATKTTARAVLKRMRHPENVLWLYFNCSGKGAYLFGEPAPDVESLLEEIGTDREMLGFFTFGEIAPVMGANYYHNYTGVLVGIE